MDTLRQSLLKSYCNYTETLQIIAAFALGIVFSPWSWGPLFFILYLAFYEILFGYLAQWKHPFWHLDVRAGVVYASVFGWIVGRILIGYEDPFSAGPDNEVAFVIQRRR